MNLLSYIESAGCAAKMCSTELNSLIGDTYSTTDSYKEDAFYYKLPSTNIVQNIDVIAPIVDNPYYFGQIAVTHALSDVYAMGATPITSMNICCFPSINSENREALSQILKGGKDKLEEAQCSCLGGHTVVDLNVKYGISVTGYVEDSSKITYNKNLSEDDTLLLTKPIGTGLLSSMLKLEKDDSIEDVIIDSCTALNSVGALLPQYDVKCMTDVSGFGLIGHLLELAKASDKSITLQYECIPVLSCIDDYVINICKEARRIIENCSAYISDISSSKLSDRQRCILFDPQTSGGLVIAVNEKNMTGVTACLLKNNISFYAIGKVNKFKDSYIRII